MDVFGWLIDGRTSEGSAGEIVGASTVIAGGVIGEPKNGMKSSFGTVIVSIMSAKYKRQDLTHKTVITECVNICFDKQGSSVSNTVNSALSPTPLLPSTQLHTENTSSPGRSTASNHNFAFKI